jgi:hypothetical protein
MGEGEWLLTTAKERAELLPAANHFRAFIRAIGQAKDHPLKSLIEGYSIKTRITFDVWQCLFLLHIIIRPRFRLPEPQTPPSF